MKFFILLFLFLFFNPLFAKTYSPQELSFLVQERAPLIKIYLEQEQSGAIQVKGSKLLANPVFTYQGGHAKTGTDGGHVMDFTLSQSIPWPGKRSSLVKSQEFLLQISRLDLEEVKLHLSHRVFLLAYQLAFDTEVEKHNKERKERFFIISKYLSTRPIASPKLILEKDLIESQIRLVEKFMNEVTARKNGLKEELALLAGISDFDISLDWSRIPALRGKNYYLSNLEEGFRLKKIKQQILLGQNRIEEARLEARPDITVGVNYRQENVSPRNYFYHGQVAVVIPILDRGQYSVQFAKAQMRKDEAGAKLALQENSTSLNYSYENLLAANESLKLFPMSLRAKSKERFRKAEEAFRKGQIDVMTFLQSDIQVHDNIDLIYTSRLEYLQSLSALELLVGNKMEFN